MSLGGWSHQRSGCRYDVLVLDLDNTIYDWVHYYAGSLRAVLKALSGALELDEDDLLGQFREVFAARGSLEYAFIVQELEATQGMKADAVERLIDLAQRTFAEARRRFLHPYEGVAETLRAARSAGVMVIAVTNAPFFQAHRRLGQLGLVDHFDALGAWEGFEIPRDPLVLDVRERFKRGEYAPRVPAHRAFGRNSLKPRDHMFRWALKAASSQPQRALAVGDSLAKDIAPALALGMAGAWSAYGARPSSDDFELLLRVTPWRQNEITETYSAAADLDFVPLNRFDDLVEVLEVESGGCLSNLNSQNR